MKNKQIIWYTFLVILMCVSIGMNAFSLLKQKKVAYINNAVLFESFQGTKEFKLKLKKEDNRRQTIIDSLQLELVNLNNQIQTNPKNEKLIELYKNKGMYSQQLINEFEYLHEKNNQEYTEQIWTQINDYVVAYGKEKNWDYIYGASGNGSLMYGSEEENITNEVIAYINEKYEGF